MLSEEALHRLLKPFAKWAGRTVLSSEIGQRGIQAALEGVEKYNEWKIENPRDAANLEATVNIAGILPVGKGVQLAGKPILKAGARALTGVSSGVGSATRKISGGIASRSASLATGVEKEVFQRASNPAYVSRLEDALEVVSKSPKQPYLPLAEKVAEGLSSTGRAVSENVGIAVDKFTHLKPGARFNLRPHARGVAESLDSFRSSGIHVALDSNAGKYVIKETRQSPFSAKEIKLLQETFDTMRDSNAVTANNLIAFQRKVAALYDAVPLGVNGNPRPYHAAVAAMTESTDEVIKDILPAELKAAYKEFSDFQKVMTEFGRKITDAQGQLKPGAESFIGNVDALNKGAIRKQVQEASGAVGLDIVDEVRVIKDAIKISPAFATTGSRNLDIVRSALIISSGAGAAGIPGGIGAALATSPKVLGKAALGIGKTKRTLGNLKEGAEDFSRNLFR